ncbi:MAG: agmatinase [Bacteroidales bacterium]|nr:agmatinase [Bacteroidales bacterium]MDT8432143.1 agmatinase [Bacteroidales bacterium]
MKRFGGIDKELTTLQRAEVLLQSIPYDGTSTWGKGADSGFEVFLEAAENMELYDIETNSEVYRKGIHILDPVTEDRTPEAVYQAVLRSTREVLSLNKFPTFFGGEHSVSIGIIDAFIEKYPGITVLQLDAHADLRSSYDGSAYNHACAVHAASRKTNLVQVGIRSMDSSELPYFDPAKCFLAEEMDGNRDWMQRSLDLAGDQVYITIDLDVFDPSVMPATGTPEPGGMYWYEMLVYLRRVFSEKQVMGFDIVEFAPIDLLNAPGFMVSKLYYKMLSYYFAYGK